jgi:hypothetical protein
VKERDEINQTRKEDVGMNDPSIEQRRPHLRLFALFALLALLLLTASVAFAGLPAGQAAGPSPQASRQGQVMGGATGDHGPAPAYPISVRIMDSPVLTCTTVVTGAITAEDPMQTGRLFRDDPGTTCDVPTDCVPFDTNQRHYDQYTFVNNTGATACVNIYLENQCGGDTSMQSAAYLGSFDPSNLCANYLGDIGATPNDGFGKQYSVSVPAGATFIVTVNEAAALLCPQYLLVVSGDICSSTTPTVVPPTETATVVPPTATSTAGTPVASATATTGAGTATATTQPGTPTATPTACTLMFEDVPVTNTFYPFVRCLACKGIIEGYPCGGDFEPCNANEDPYFRPNNPVTRGQISKMISLSAGFNEPVPSTQQSFEDVPYGSPFWEYVERLYTRGVVGGYECGADPGEPCIPPENRPYFRPNAGATRGQLVKIASESAGYSDTIPPDQYTFTDMPPGSTFWLYIERLLANRPDAVVGYPCGGPDEPCDPQNRPYFRPNNGVTRGQASKIVVNTFDPECNPPRP